MADHFYVCLKKKKKSTWINEKMIYFLNYFISFFLLGNYCEKTNNTTHGYTENELFSIFL